MNFPTPMTRDELRHELQLAINLALSCWARMETEECQMALRLACRFENHEGRHEMDWRKVLRDELEEQDE
jgi:hypothetical protein